MNKSMLSLAAAMALLAPAVSVAAEPIYGVWVREGHPTDKLEFYDCNGKLCAKGVLPMLDGSPPPIVLRSAAKTGPNSWKGDLFNPEDGKTYTGKITYDSPTQFTLTGCLMAFLCQSETWERVSGPPKPKPEVKPEAKAEGKTDGKSHEDAKVESKGEAKADAKTADKAQAGSKPAADAAKPHADVAKPHADAAKPHVEAAKPHADADKPHAAPKHAEGAAPKAAPAHPRAPDDEAN